MSTLESMNESLHIRLEYLKKNLEFHNRVLSTSEGLIENVKDEITEIEARLDKGIEDDS